MTRGGLTARQRDELHAELAERWPLIGWWLDVTCSGWVNGKDGPWSEGAKSRGLTVDEVAAGYEQWAQFYEWRRDRRTAERGWDSITERWTDSYCYVLRRLAARARGEDPGPWIEQWERRPDIFTRADELREAGEQSLQVVA